MQCEWHLCNVELVGQQRKFCSIKCKSKFHVTATRRRNKEKLVAHFGGECVRCGYNKSMAALQFHHSNDNKSFGLSEGGSTKSYAKLLEEAEKCELICANCHAEEHSGVADW